LRPNWSELEWK